MLETGTGVEAVVVNAFSAITPAVVETEIKESVPSADGSGCIAFAMSCVAIASRIHSSGGAAAAAPPAVGSDAFVSLVREVDEAVSLVDENAHIMTGMVRPFAAFSVYCRAMAVTVGRKNVPWNSKCPSNDRAVAWLAWAFNVYIGFESTLAIWNKCSAEMEIPAVDAMCTPNIEKVFEQHTGWQRLTAVSLSGDAGELLEGDLDSVTMALVQKTTGSDPLWSSVIFTARDQISEPSGGMPMIVHVVDHWVVRDRQSFTRVPSLIHAVALWCSRVEGSDEQDIAVKYGCTAETGTLVCRIRDGTVASGST